MKSKKAKEVVFVTNNPYKFEELSEIFNSYGIKLKRVAFNISEIQTEDMDKIILDKTLKAFERVMRPVMVDHSGLSIAAFGGMPKGLTQLFWDKLEGDNICRLVASSKNYNAEAITGLGFCDGKNIYSATSILPGQISDSPKTGRNFQWDSIFIPKDHTKAYSEMNISEKNKFSQRKEAAVMLVHKLRDAKFI